MLTEQLPAYPYLQYSDDPDIVAFFDAYSGTNGAGDSLNPSIPIIAMSYSNGIRTVQSSENLGIEVGDTFQVSVNGAAPADWNSPGIVTATVILADTFTYADPIVHHPGPPTDFGTWTIEPPALNAQGYLDAINALNLPVYTEQSGALLDWVGNSLYGQPRENLVTALPVEIGAINTGPIDTQTINTNEKVTLGGVVAVSDAAYIAILLWNNYKGDGFQFTIRWLKRRVIRFLAGLLTYHGVVTPNPDQTYQVSVSFPSGNNCHITISAGKYSLALKPVLAAAILNGVLVLPLQYVFTVV